MRYFLLKRYISPYTREDIILGLFTSEKLAQQYRKKYIKQCCQSDPFGEQGYHQIDLEEDVTLVDVTHMINIFRPHTDQLIFIVSYYEEGMGQITRKLISILEAEAAALMLIQKMEEDEPSYEASWYDYEVIKLNIPCFDTW